MDIVFIIDCTSVPFVLTSAKLKYLLSLEISVSIAMVLPKYVLNISFPVLSNVCIIDLYVVPVSITEVYPFLFTVTRLIFPSKSFSQIILFPEIKYIFCFPFSAISIYLLLISTMGFAISTVSSYSFFPDEL